MNILKTNLKISNWGEGALTLEPPLIVPQNM
jgi:hypothetical protein